MSDIAISRQKVLGISDASGVAEARRAVAQLGSTAQFDERTSGELAIEPVANGVKKGLKLVFSDNGPGIADIELAMKDGYTTGGGMGLGLGGSKRLASEFQIESQVGVGTRVSLTRWK